jgi:DNA primase
MGEVLAPLEDSMLLGQFVSSVAQMLGAGEDEVLRMVRTKAEQRRRRERTVPPAADAYETYEGAPEAPVAFDESGSFAILSKDERFQLRAERELLSMLVRDPEPVRALAERIAGISWADTRHETLAWALLSAPEQMGPGELVALASRLVPEAPQILSGGEVSLFAAMPAQEKARFLVDVVELASCRRLVRAEQGRLGLVRDAKESADIGRSIMVLQQRIAALERGLPSHVTDA